MWRFIAAIFIFVIAVAVGELAERLSGDETLGWLVALMLAGCGIACLWPVYFGLREPPER